LTPPTLTHLATTHLATSRRHAIHHALMATGHLARIQAYPTSLSPDCLDQATAKTPVQ